MKRILSAALCLVLALGLAAPALAEQPEDMEAALAGIASQVKEILDIDDDYTEFTGNYSDGVTPGWELYWSDDTRSLSVSCTAQALVTSVYRWQDGQGHDRYYGYDAAFPALPEDDARESAEHWLARLMGDGESARIDDTFVTLDADSYYRFSGRVLKNGLESPVTFQLRIDESGLAGYSRSDSYRGYIRDVPSARAAVRERDAASALADAVEFELYYVTDGDEARLRYVPVGPYTVVDAQSGETVDMDALYDSVGGAYNGPEAPMAEESMAADAGGGRGLTEVELSSISNYADALDQQALDGLLRSVGDLGLADFELNRCSYTMDPEGSITASLRYICELTADRLFGYALDGFWEQLDWGGTPTAYKYITVDAKTGALMSVSTSYPLWERENEDEEQDERTAEGFLRTVAPEMFAESALCTLSGYDKRDGLTYARVHDGYFFPENTLYVSLNPATGTVDRYDYTWDGDAAFAASRGIVKEDAALRAYTGALDLTLGYVAWPEAVDYDDPVLFAAYIDWGYSWVESLRLAYYYGGTGEVSGVDALNGRAIVSEPGDGYVYDDLEGNAHRAQIEALAEAGIGFSGGRFLPDEPLTMRDAAALLVQSAGYGAEEWEDDQLRSQAAYLGFLDTLEWEPDRTLIRSELVRMLIGASRYGYAAALDGLWPEGDGYAAIAGALGMELTGPNEACTRSDAAALLYAFMKAR